MEKIELKNSMPKRGDFLDTEFGKAEIVEDPERSFELSSGNFVATAEDELGAIYTLRWELTNQKHNDDCEACDWTKFSVEKI